MAQRTDARATYQPGKWKARDQGIYGQRKPKGEPRPPDHWQGWSAESWFHAHLFRWGQDHGPNCPCLRSPLKLWRRLHKTGIFRSPSLRRCRDTLKSSLPNAKRSVP